MTSQARGVSVTKPLGVLSFLAGCILGFSSYHSGLEGVVGLPSSTASPFDLLAESSEGEEAFRVVDEDLVLSSRARLEHASMGESGEHPFGCS